jgi:hypothetical protein
MKNLVLLFVVIIICSCSSKAETINTNLTMGQFLRKEGVTINTDSTKLGMTFKYVSKFIGPTPNSWKTLWNDGKNKDCALWISGSCPDDTITFFFSNFPPPT